VLRWLADVGASRASNHHRTDAARENGHKAAPKRYEAFVRYSHKDRKSLAELRTGLLSEGAREDSEHLQVDWTDLLWETTEELLTPLP